MSKKERLIFITPTLASFNKGDVKILSEQYDVRVHHDNWSNAKLVPWLFFKQFFQLLIGLPGSKAVVSSFCSYWTFWPSLLGRLFGVPVYVIIHGTDACNFPEISYGDLRKPRMRFFSHIAYRNATMLLPVSDSLIQTSNTYFDPKHPKAMGVKVEFPSVKTPYRVIANGLDIDFWKTDEVTTKEPMKFVTVASRKQHLRKGIDLILQVAGFIPEAVFIVIGSDKPEEVRIPDNVEFTGQLSQKELIAHFHKSEFYLQLSAFEGFGLSLCEAMLCGCIPIGSSVNAIPDIIGQSGFVLQKRDSEALVTLLQQAIRTPEAQKEDLRRKAALRIEETFSLSRRASAFFEVLEQAERP